MSAEQSTVAVGYIRVASGSLSKRERSVYLQRKDILGHAKMHNVQVVRFFADHECIADTAYCQGLSDALAFIASGKATALMVASLDRLTPSTDDLCRFAKQQRVGQDGPALISVKEQLDTRIAKGRLMLGAIEAVHRAELAVRNLGDGHAES